MRHILHWKRGLLTDLPQRVRDPIGLAPAAPQDPAQLQYGALIRDALQQACRKIPFRHGPIDLFEDSSLRRRADLITQPLKQPHHLWKTPPAELPESLQFDRQD